MGPVGLATTADTEFGTVNPMAGLGPTAPNIVLTVDKTAYVEGTDDAIEITATATPAPSAELTVNVRVEGGGVGGFFSGSGDTAHNNTITINADTTTGTVDYNINNDSVQEADTTDQVMARVREPDTAGAYTFDNSGAPTFMVSNDDQQSAAPSITSATAGNGEITVVWSAPSDTGSSDLTNYAVCVDTDVAQLRNNNCDFGLADFEFAADEDGDTSDTNYQYTVTGLTNGTDYYVGVAARNGVLRPQGSVFTGVSVYAVYQESGSDATVTPTATTTPTLPALSIAATGAPFTEGTDDNASFTVTSDTQAPSGGLPVSVTLSGADDFVAAADRTQTGTIAEGATTVMVNFPITNDDVDEADVTATATLAANTAYTITTATATATISDDDEAATPTGEPAASPTAPGNVVAVASTTGTPSITVTWDLPAQQPSGGNRDGFHVCAVENGPKPLVRGGDDFLECNSLFTYASVADPGATSHVLTDFSQLASVESGKSYRVGVSIYRNSPVLNGVFTTVGYFVTPTGDGGTTPTQSSDTSLDMLTVDQGTLMPAFTAGSATTEYSVTVANNIEEIEVNARSTGRNTEATTTITANTDDTLTDTVANTHRADVVVELVEGENIITITVVAENGDMQAYTLTVTRAAAALSSDATLSALTLSGIDFGAFLPGTTDYTAMVGNDVESTTVTATAADVAGASVVITATPNAPTGTNNNVVALNEGGNTITVTVTAEDTTTTEVYTVTVTREGEPEEDMFALPTLVTATGGEGTTITVGWTGPSNQMSYAICYGLTSDDWADVDEFLLDCDDDFYQYGYTVADVTGVGGANTEVITVPAGTYYVAVGSGTTTTNEGYVAAGTTATVTTPASDDATLSSLTMVGVTFDSAFAPGTAAYTASVNNDITATTVTAIAEDDGADQCGDCIQHRRQHHRRRRNGRAGDRGSGFGGRRESDYGNGNR